MKQITLYLAAVHGIRPVQHNHALIPAGAGLHTIGHRVNKSINARAGILKIEEKHVDIFSAFLPLAAGFLHTDYALGFRYQDHDKTRIPPCCPASLLELRAVGPEEPSIENRHQPIARPQYAVGQEGRMPDEPRLRRVRP